MEIEEGALLVLRRANYIANDASLDAARPVNKDQAKAIAAELDGLPFALNLAAAYIEESGRGVSGYLDVHRRMTEEFRASPVGRAPISVAFTFAREIEQANPASADPLRLCAFMYPDEIPEGVFSEGGTELGPVLAIVGSDALASLSS
jgi:hypothetical protein